MIFEILRMKRKRQGRQGGEKGKVLEDTDTYIQTQWTRREEKRKAMIKKEMKRGKVTEGMTSKFT